MNEPDDFCKRNAAFQLLLADHFTQTRADTADGLALLANALGRLIYFEFEDPTEIEKTLQGVFRLIRQQSTCKTGGTQQSTNKTGGTALH